MNWSKSIQAIFRLLFPEHCCICERRLDMKEAHLCINCYASLPFARLHGTQGNKLERLFWGRIPIVRATAFLKYKAKKDSRFLFFKLKYYDRPAIGVTFGQIMAADVKDKGFFEEVDALIPIPLAPKRYRQRGYNQSEMLAKGIAIETGIPVWSDCVVRTVETTTQTHLTTAERIKNVKNIFSVRNPQQIVGKHLLLIDDVITSGATILSCAEELSKVEGVKISIMSLGLAGRHRLADGINEIESIQE